MTRQASRPAQCGNGNSDSETEADILAGLWEIAHFPRVPADAPPELQEYVHEIENPKRVYSVHRASRRHGFQVLVEKYVVQLRQGCGTKTCTTPTCFSYRKRAVGDAPIRRYNTTSARTLAVYLASQDHPETALCPFLRTPKEAPAASQTLTFVPHPDQHGYGFKKGDFPVSSPPRKERPGIKMNGKVDKASPSSATDQALPELRRKASQESERSTTSKDWPRSQDASTHVLRLRVNDRPVSKDYRSFAANVFGSVTFKMLEWLSPNGVEDMQKKASEVGSHPSDSREGSPETTQPKTQPEEPPETTQPKTQPEEQPNGTVPRPATVKENGVVPQSGERTGSPPETIEPPAGSTHESKKSTQPPPPPPLAAMRRNSSTKVRTSGPKTKKRKSLEHFSPISPSEDIKPGILSPRLNGISSDKLQRAPKTAQLSNGLALPTHNTAPVRINGSLPISSAPESPTEDETEPEKLAAHSDAETTGKASPKVSPPKAKDQPCALAASPSRPLSQGSVLPQSLSHMSVEVIHFLCDVLREDGAAEGPLFDSMPEAFPSLKVPVRALTRRRARRGQNARKVKKEWRSFVEQALFDTLSNPHSLVRSFTTDRNLLDSHTLWYCMLHLTRAAPSLVFESLWIAAASLFAPPKSLQALRSPTTRGFRRTAKPLSNEEAGFVLSICLHALVAALPLVRDASTLREMSETRSNGLALPASGPTASSPRTLPLQYDDVFSNELAIRLARRLFLALTARRYFAEMADREDSVDDSGADVDLLRPLFTQLENSEPITSLDFPSSERAVYDIRIPTLLLDWAKSIMLREWDGQAEFSRDGPFGGALLLIAAMHGNREALMIGDAQFRVDFFGERLDSVEVPLAWLDCRATRQRQHLLDYPFIFSPASRVSYFRSINFSRMSAGYEDANSLPVCIRNLDESRMFLSDEHSVLLENMLKKSLDRYLVVGVARKHVLRDAFNQLWKREERELLRPLKVHLGEGSGEEGFDSGGVQQEFFRMAIAECLDPKYGAFSLDDRTRMSWFVPGSLVEEWKMEMIGLLVSLAVYNGLVLPVTFPRALYHKLLGRPVTELHHIADGWPDLASGLTQLLEWDEKDGLVEDVFARTYEFSVSAFGQPVSRSMAAPAAVRRWPAGASTKDGPPPSAGNPEDAPLVTNANRNSYVTDYIDWLTGVSVSREYEAFARGFRACLQAKALRLLTPGLLQSVVEGVQEIDVAELRRHARYVGWDATHRTVRDFWSIVKRYDDGMKRRLLEFVTASDRVPVGGVEKIQFVVQKNGTQEGPGGHLPTAYTCYGTLLLPEYRDKEVLRERLAMALENAQGFGFA